MESVVGMGPGDTWDEASYEVIPIPTHKAKVVGSGDPTASSHIDGRPKAWTKALGANVYN